MADDRIIKQARKKSNFGKVLLPTKGVSQDVTYTSGTSNSLKFWHEDRVSTNDKMRYAEICLLKIIKIGDGFKKTNILKKLYINI